MNDMNYLGDELVYLQEARVNQWPDRRDRAVPRRYGKSGGKEFRADRFSLTVDAAQAEPARIGPPFSK